MQTTCSKTYPDFPFAHRQPNHKGHCALIHGHNWSFTFVFGATTLDANGFVVDFGDLKWLKEWLTKMFDHTLVLNSDDPWLQFLSFHLVDVTDPQNLGGFKECCHLADIRTVPNCGAEGLASYLLKEVDDMLAVRYGSRVRLVSVTVHEDSKNTATVTA